MKLDASRAIGSEEGCEEACEDAYEDDCESIRGLFGLPLLLEVASRLPLLPAVRVSPKGVLETLVRARKRVEVLSQYLKRLATFPRGVLNANVVFIIRCSEV